MHDALTQSKNNILKVPEDLLTSVMMPAKLIWYQCDHIVLFYFQLGEEVARHFSLLSYCSIIFSIGTCVRLICQVNIKWLNV